MFKVLNPGYKPPGILKAETAVTKLQQHINALDASVESVSFDDIRQIAIDAGLGLTADELPDGYICHIAELAGFTVER